MISAQDRDKKSVFSTWLLVAVFSLLGLGVVMVFSASGVMAEKLYHDHYYFFKRQFVFMLGGMILIYVLQKIPVNFFFKLVYLWLFLALILLSLTLSPLGVRVGGSARWLTVGGFRLQPLELVKIALVLYLAYFFSHKQEKIKTFSVGFLPPVLVTTLFAGLLCLQPDFGGAVFVTSLFFLMSLVGGTRFIYLGSSLLLTVLAGGLMVYYSPYRLKRWLAFLDPFASAKGAGFQIVQSLYALGNGKLTGLGLGAGKQKLFFLPEAHTDFILAVLGEELGFLGLSLVFVCLLIILFCTLKMALAEKDLQRRFTIIGLSWIILLGGSLNLAVVLGALPPKGLPMPFISYGGSNLLALCFCVGMILHLARERGE